MISIRDKLENNEPSRSLMHDSGKSPNLGFPEEPGLMITSGDLFESSEAEVLQLNPIRPDFPPFVSGFDILSFQFLGRISRRFGSSECRTVPEQIAG